MGAPERIEQLFFPCDRVVTWFCNKVCCSLRARAFVTGKVRLEATPNCDGTALRPTVVDGRPAVIERVNACNVGSTIYISLGEGIL